MKQKILCITFTAFVAAAASIGAKAQNAQMKWLGDEAPGGAIGVSWGVPWPEGKVQRNQQFRLTTMSGQTKPLQSWTLAYWPDGSIKWTGFATTANADDTGAMTIKTGQTAEPNGATVRVISESGYSVVDTGVMQVRLSSAGQGNLINSITMNGREVARNGRLEAILQVGSETDYLHPSPREAYVSLVKNVTIEQDGPVRAVAKFEGYHKAVNGSREWLPFIVRLYFYAGIRPIKVVHTIMFDGNKNNDFVRGLTMVLDVPLRGGLRERNVRFAESNGGLWSESVITGGGFGGLGRRGGADTQDPSAHWNDFKLVQPNAEGFSIVKRTNDQSSWVDAAQGNRASGYVFIGDGTGGLGIAMKNFWQSHPSALEVSGAAGEAATVRAWLWSPDGPAMDMRFYDTRGHGNVNSSGNYEDYEEGYDDPIGVARTSELILYPSEQMPAREESVAQAAMANEPPLLTVSPGAIHAAGVFGIWSLPDRSTPFKASVEERLAGGLDYYKKSIEQHYWYGFWNYGDVRHAYDAQRHVWRYDVGGYAWDNTELGSVLWLWYSYIRTGDADVFRMAEEMTRHTSEVDTYHFGRFAGLGSRHNVVHWGDSAKEPRVGQAAHNRFYYYLTTDERIGDIMKMVLIADKTTSEVDMMRKAQPRNEQEAKYPGRVRIGPDWLAFVSNWMTEWERTGDTKWRDKIMAGVNSMAQMPYGMRTGRNLVMGYDPETGKLYQVDNTPGTYNLTTIQGGAEVAFELTDLLDDPTWEKLWLQYCRLGNAPGEVLLRDKETGTEGADASMVGEQGGSNSQGTARLAAYAYYKTKNPAFAERAIRGIGYGRIDYNASRIEPPAVLNPVDEAPGVSTNTAAQSSLMDIEILEMVKDRLPTEAPQPQPTGSRGQFGTRASRGERRAGR
ncbi:MAG: hypothetical protein JW787_06985 [Sedimentisphaerales bacterium]|nr:hypothetical protein [Sedimentisphaerales bacterium]